MPTTLSSKFLEDGSGTKYAPITTPNAVRFSDGSNLNDKLCGFDVPTLNSAPTSSTTTYTKDGVTVDFIIGQYARVADANEDTGYKFYILHDITTSGNTKTAHWQETGAGGVYSVLQVELSTNDDDDTSLATARCFVTIGSGSEQELTASVVNHRKTLTVNIAPGTHYTMRITDVTGYATPTYTSTDQTKMDGLTLVQLRYDTENVTVVVNQTGGSDSDIAGATVTMTDMTAFSTVSPQANGKYKIPAGHTYQVSVSDIQDYMEPTHIPEVACTDGRTSNTVTMTYVAGNMYTGYIILDQTSSNPTTKVLDEQNRSGSSYVRPDVIDYIRAASHRYVGTFDNNVMSLKQLDDTDGTQYADGADASTDIAGGNADVFMRLPYFFTRVSTVATDKIKIEFAYDPSQTATTTQNPGSGWKQWGGNELIGVYEGSSYDPTGQDDPSQFSNWLLCSINGVESTGGGWQNSTAYGTQPQFKQCARNRGNGFTLVKWRHHCIMAILYYAYYGNTNCQEQCGYGANAYSGEYRTTGLKDALGMTDTTSLNGNTDNINFWGLENWWGCKCEWIDNVQYTSSGFQVTEDDNTVRTVIDFSNMTHVSANPPYSYFGVWTNKLLLGENLDIVPTNDTVNDSGNDDAGYCDGQYFVKPDDGTPVVACRSSSDAYSDGGVACVGARFDSTDASGNVGSRLAIIEESAEVGLTTKKMRQRQGVT